MASNQVSQDSPKITILVEKAFEEITILGEFDEGDFEYQMDCTGVKGKHSKHKWVAYTNIRKFSGTSDKSWNWKVCPSCTSMVASDSTKTTVSKRAHEVLARRRKALSK